jgi:hypothetical protein
LMKCSSNADCEAPRICGFIDGNEAMGLRCVEPGATPDGDACVLHSDCASRFCAGSVCAQRCDVTSNCNAGDECQAVEVGGLGIVAGACMTASCGCTADQVCNLQGTCGPGPLCNQDDDCSGGDICAFNHCRPTCQQTDQCQAGEDCTGLSANQPHVCLPATCGCAGTQVCDGGSCFESRPCFSDDDCDTPPGRCLGDQCYDLCSSTTECPGGLECVAVRTNPPDLWSVRLCSVPTCSCQDADTWCWLDGNDNKYCYRGNDCSLCDDIPDSDFQCWWVDSVEDVGEACRCTNVSVCGPSCSNDSDCQPGYLCGATNACEIVTCETDADCPGGTVCGAHPTMNYQGRACWHPGSTPDGENCNNHQDCQSAACIWNICTSLCSLSGECAASEVCSYGIPEYPNEVAVCYAEDSSSCTGGCAADEWCYNGGCYAGQACWFDYNSCDTGFACDGVICQPECASSNECPAEQECILADFYDWDVVNATKICRDAECHCRNRDDVCRSNASQGGDQRYCLRAVPCNAFLNPCPEQPNYTCACAPTTTIADPCA